MRESRLCIPVYRPSGGKTKMIVWTKVFAIRLLHMYLLRKLGQVTLIHSFDNTSSQSLELSQC